MLLKDLILCNDHEITECQCQGYLKMGGGAQKPKVSEETTLSWKPQMTPGPQGKALFSHHLQVGNLSRTIEKINGVARCPYDPRHNSTAVISSQGELYAATVIDFSGRDPAIYRSLGSGPPLRTAQYNSKWLNGKVAQA